MDINSNNKISTLYLTVFFCMLAIFSLACHFYLTDENVAYEETAQTYNQDTQKKLS